MSDREPKELHELFRIRGMSQRSLAFSRLVWSIIAFAVLVCVIGGCRDKPGAGETKRQASPSALGSSPHILADPLERQQPKSPPPIDTPTPSNRPESSASETRHDCPRKLETFAANGCDTASAKAQLVPLWRHWRMCADVSGFLFRDNDDARVALTIRNRQASVGQFELSQGIPSALESCMRASIKAETFRLSDGCQITLFWSPLPTPDCR